MGSRASPKVWGVHLAASVFFLLNTGRGGPEPSLSNWSCWFQQLGLVSSALWEVGDTKVSLLWGSAHSGVSL